MHALLRLANVVSPFLYTRGLPALLASIHSLLLYLRQVAQCAVPCLFLADIACHYVSLYRSLTESLFFLLPLPFLQVSVDELVYL